MGFIYGVRCLTKLSYKRDVPSRIDMMYLYSLTHHYHSLFDLLCAELENGVVNVRIEVKRCGTEGKTLCIFDCFE